LASIWTGSRCFGTFVARATRTATLVIHDGIFLSLIIGAVAKIASYRFLRERRGGEEGLAEGGAGERGMSRCWGLDGFRSSRHVGWWTIAIAIVVIAIWSVVIGCGLKYFIMKELQFPTIKLEEYSGAALLLSFIERSIR
jgi:hypothetical protein